MGCGLDRTYPADHRQLRESIAQQGAVLSNCRWGPRRSYHFPRRNRIISGLSFGCRGDGGHRAERVTSLLHDWPASRGAKCLRCRALSTRRIAEVGIVCFQGWCEVGESAQDILEELLPQLDVPFREQLSARGAGHNRRSLELGADEAHVYDAVSVLPQSIDRVIRRSGLPAAHVSRSCSRWN